ncbi:MAG: phage tail protein [Clostridiales Family XIII bacterium]|jgi:phage tail-like protein|nr:phage tail protein [Clostridiales Family XIII bacterium]
MADFGATAAAYKSDGKNLPYPYTKMNFQVMLGTENADVASFSEISGIDATVDVVEFRQGNASSLAPVKIPGLVKHGNITMKFGLTDSAAFRIWIANCISDTRQVIPRADLVIELIDIIAGSPAQIVDTIKNANMTWQLKNAWVCKYTGTDLNALQSEIAIESIEVAYEEMILIPFAPAASAT